VLNDIFTPVAAPLARTWYRPKVEGLENVPRTGPVIIAPNHLSFAENVLIPAVMSRPTHFLIKAEYVQGQGLGGRTVAYLFRHLGYVPVQRGGERNAIAGSLSGALDVLNAGKIFLIYPEGTRSPDGRLYKGHTGVARLALASGAPVVPVGCLGTDLMQPVGARFPRRRPATLRFGKPISFADRPDKENPEVWRQVTDEIVQEIQRLSGQEYIDLYKSQLSPS
jgi:1-acyl-sn-glycerol-3-phosphate acyltransferase